MPIYLLDIRTCRVCGSGYAAGYEHVIGHLLELASPRRKVLFTCGWMITPADEDAIKMLPGSAWKPGIGQGGHPPDEPGREVAGRPAVDRPPHEAVPAAGGEPDRLREGHWLAVLHHLHEHPRNRDPRGSGDPPPAVHRRRAPPARRRGGRRPEREGDGPAQPALEDVAGQPRLGHRGEHRRRPGRLVAAPGPLRPGRAEGRRAGHAPLPAVEHTCPHRPPRPPAILKISPGWPLKEAFLTCWQRLHAMPEPT